MEGKQAGMNEGERERERVLWVLCALLCRDTAVGKSEWEESFGCVQHKEPSSAADRVSGVKIIGACCTCTLFFVYEHKRSEKVEAQLA